MKKIRHKIIADSLLLIHLGWIALLIGGTIYVSNHPWYVPYHLVIVTGTLLLNLALGGCPLTWLEEEYRKAWDPKTEPYQNSFVAAHLKRMFGFKITPAQVNWILFIIKAFSYYVSIRLLIIS
jgi:hypothetical protein